MQSRMLISLIPVLAAFSVAVPTVAQAQGMTSKGIFMPKMMTITVEYVDVPLPVFLKASRQIPAGQDHDALLLTTLLKGGAPKSEQPLITTPDGVTGRLDMNQSVPTTADRNNQPVFIPLDNFVEVTPHSNTGGTITLTFKTQRVMLIPNVTPLAATTNMLSTTQTFHEGQTLTVSIVVDSTNADAMTHLEFVKVAKTAP